MKVVALFNGLGGGGKTSLTRDLGYLLAHDHGKSVLLIDADQTTSLSAMLGLISPPVEQSFYRSIANKQLLPLPAPAHVHGLDLIPASKEYVSLAAELERTPKEEPFDSRLKQALGMLEKQYDYALIDTPPGMSAITRLVLGAAESVVVPLETSPKSLIAIRSVWDTVYAAAATNPALRIAMHVPTISERRAVATKKLLSTFEYALTEIAGVSSPLWRRSSVYNQAQFSKIPIPKLDPHCAATAELQAVTQELLQVWEEPSGNRKVAGSETAAWNEQASGRA